MEGNRIGNNLLLARGPRIPAVLAQDHHNISGFRVRPNGCPAPPIRADARDPEKIPLQTDTHEGLLGQRGIPLARKKYVAGGRTASYPRDAWNELDELTSQNHGS